MWLFHQTWKLFNTVCKAENSTYDEIVDLIILLFIYIKTIDLSSLS